MWLGFYFMKFPQHVYDALPRPSIDPTRLLIFLSAIEQNREMFWSKFDSSSISLLCNCMGTCISCTMTSAMVQLLNARPHPSIKGIDYFDDHWLNGSRQPNCRSKNWAIYGYAFNVSRLYRCFVYVMLEPRDTKSAAIRLGQHVALGCLRQFLCQNVISRHSLEAAN